MIFTRTRPLLRHLYLAFEDWLPAYNIFSIVIFALFIYIIPRLTDSLHPGNGGNPAFSKYDLDSSLRMFFYPACIGWILLGFWIFSILVRVELLKQKQEL